MAKWENKIVEIGAVSTSTAQAELNNGHENWELVTIIPLHMGFWAIFKRPKPKRLDLGDDCLVEPTAKSSKISSGDMLRPET
jgi:hypothetical protein